MLYFPSWVKGIHHQIHIALHTSGKDDWLALLSNIVDEVVKVLPFVNTEICIICFIFPIEVVLTNRS
jgi:hypothetical protein